MYNVYCLRPFVIIQVIITAIGYRLLGSSIVGTYEYVPTRYPLVTSEVDASGQETITDRLASYNRKT